MATVTVLSSHCLYACIEPVAGVIQGRSGANIRVSPLNSASGQVSNRAIQW